MRVLITGGTGLIGRAVVKELALAGYEVVVLSRNPSSKSSFPSGVKVVGWDAQTSTGWGHLADGADAIVNLAGESIAGENFFSLIAKRWTPARKQLILESRMQAGNAVLQAVREAKIKPKVVVQASAVGYYGSRKDEELTEFSMPAEDFVAKICMQWEASTAPVEALGVRHVIIRTAGVAMSLEGGAFPFMLLPFRLFVGGPLGSGKQWFSWIHIQDEARAIRFLIENDAACGVFNLTAPQSITNAQLSKILGLIMHRPSFIPVPGFALHILFGEKADILLSSQRQIPMRLRDIGFKFLFPDIEAALRDLLKN